LAATQAIFQDTIHSGNNQFPGGVSWLTAAPVQRPFRLGGRKLVL